MQEMSSKLELTQKWQSERVKAGLCRRCGAKRGKKGTSIHCQGCKVLDREASKRRYLLRKRAAI